jgi:hypothetical protein
MALSTRLLMTDLQAHQVTKHPQFAAGGVVKPKPVL